MQPRRIAVIGAGPIGLEAALLGVEQGHDVRLYERGTTGAQMSQWGHVRLFSPTAYNRSERVVRRLSETGCDLPTPDAFLTGAEHVERFLAPLATLPELSGRIEERTRVVGVGRDRIGKATHPFRLLLETPSGERLATHDVVLDCSGTYGQPNWLGGGGIPTAGERKASPHIDRQLVDIDSRRAELEGRRVLLVGDGLSAATALDALTRLAAIEVLWVSPQSAPPVLPEPSDDPLPERLRLSRLANRLASAADPRIHFLGATSVERIDHDARGFSVTLAGPAGVRSEQIDRVLSHVGFHPDASLYRQLQVHECYVTRGPMKLAGSLLGAASEDCLAQPGGGADLLRNPEPDFFILGAKSYGTRSNFLIRSGVEQVEQVFSLIAADAAQTLEERTT